MVLAICLQEPVVPDDIERRLETERQIADILGPQFFFDRSRPDIKFQPVPTLLKSLDELKRASETCRALSYQISLHSDERTRHPKHSDSPRRTAVTIACAEGNFVNCPLRCPNAWVTRCHPRSLGRDNRTHV